MITLRPMAHSEFSDWTKTHIADYAADKERSLGITSAQARQLAERSFASLLPKGMATPDAYLFVAETADGTNVGSLWFQVGTEYDEKTCFIYDITVEDGHRRKGYGRQMLAQLNKIAEGLNASSIGLHVFGFNDAAIALYRGCGYEVTDMTMVRQVSS